MKWKMRILVMVTGMALWATATPSAYAASGDGEDSFFQLGIGASFWNAADMDVIDNECLFGGTFIGRFRPASFLAMDLRVGGLGTWAEADYYYDHGHRGEMDVFASCIPFEAAVLAFLPLSDGFSLYAGPGVGYYYYYGEAEYSYGHHSWRVDLDLDDDFGWFLVAGGTIRATDQLSFFLEAKYTSSETAMEVFEDDVSYNEEIDCSGLGVNIGLLIGF